MLLLAGCFGFLYLAVVFTRLHRAQAAANQAVATQATSAQPPAREKSSADEPLSGTLAYSAAASRTATGAILGRLDIPKLKISVPLIDGVRDADLQRGLGTVGIAAHRDTFFRPLREIAPGAQIVLGSAQGSFTYEVVSTEIVNPDQVNVLDLADSPQLTLITCYPFNYIGAAPKRFIVHARLLSLEPSLPR